MSKRYWRLLLIGGVVGVLMMLAVAALAQVHTEAEAEEIAVTHFDLMWVAGVVGFFLPLLISFIKRSQWSTTVKQGVALVTSIGAGIITVGVQAGLEFDRNFLPNMAMGIVDVYIASAVTYANFWKDKAIDRALESVGSKGNHVA